MNVNSEYYLCGIMLLKNKVLVSIVKVLNMVLTVIVLSTYK